VSAPDSDQLQMGRANARLVPRLEARGFGFVRVCENLSTTNERAPMRAE